MTTILSTKKIGKWAIQKAKKANLKLIQKNFIKIQAIDFKLNKVNNHIIFTSLNALKIVLKSAEKDILKEKKIFCVGIKTQKLLEKKKYHVEACFDYAEDVANLISKDYNKQSFTFFSGNIRKNTLPDNLSKNNIIFNEIVVYQTHLQPKKVEHKLNAILFFSPSAIESYLTKNEIKDEICFCIGKTTATELASRLDVKKSKNILVAKKPTFKNVIKQAINHLK